MDRIIVVSREMAKKKASPLTVALLAQKGGAGKTTIAVGLAEWLASKNTGVRLLDGNSGQQSLSRWAEARRQNSVNPPLEVLPTFEVLSDRGQAYLKDHTAELLRKTFDGVTLLDLPGGTPPELGPALRYCDIAIVPMPLMAFDYFSLTEIAALVQSAEAVRKADGRAPAKVFLVVNKRSRILAQDQVMAGLQQAAGRIGLPICGTELGNLNDHYAAQLVGRSPVSFAPSGKAAQQVDSLARELELR